MSAAVREIAPEQRTWVRVAAVLVFVKHALELLGDSVTIIGRTGKTFAETVQFATESQELWRLCLLEVGLAWLTVAVWAFALYVVLAPVDRRLAQLALILRLGASFVGASSVMFRMAQSWIFRATADGTFTVEQLRLLSGVMSRASGAGVILGWMAQSAGALLFWVLFLRSRYVPRWVAVLGIVGSVLLFGASAVMFVYPQRINELKLLGLVSLLADVIAAVWLLTRGLPRAKAPALVEDAS